MVTGAHVIIGSSDADADRAFLRDVLELGSIDVGDGWLIFALPPAEAAIHPGKDSRHELYLTCDDVDATAAELRRRGAEVSTEILEQPWGRLAYITLPGGGMLPIYQPKHPSPPAHTPGS